MHHYKVKSASSPDKSYIVEDHETFFTCDCAYFVYNKQCKHIEFVKTHEIGTIETFKIEHVPEVAWKSLMVQLIEAGCVVSHNLVMQTLRVTGPIEEIEKARVIINSFL